MAQDTITNGTTQYNYGSSSKKDVPQWVVVDSWNSAYYSGLDVSMYFGDIFMDEIVQLQFNEVEQVRPLFGYADYVFRKVSRGSRLISGAFTINFKESGYVPKILELLKDPYYLNRKLSKMGSKATATSKKSTGTKTSSEISADNFAGLAISNDFTLEDFLSYTGGKGDVSGDSQYAKTMDALDDAYWKTASDSTSSAVATRLARERARRKPRYATTASGFDIIIKYGQPEDMGDLPGWGTLEKIKNCHITGVNKMIDDSGRNVLEAYSFLAATIE